MDSTVVLLIDDHALFRAGMRMMLKAGIADLEVREADSLERALRIDSALSVRLVLLDIHLQGLNGIEGIALVQGHWPTASIAMLSSQFDTYTSHVALQRGAVALLSKADPAESFLLAVRRLLEGAPNDGAQTPTPRGAQGGNSAQSLTPRQAEVLDFLCQGLPNKVIGRRLDLSENTVRGHVQATLAALGASSRSEAVYAARRAGLAA